MTSFVPNFVVEFVGHRRLTVEVDLETRLALFIAGDRWWSYELDSREAASLRELFELELIEPNQLSDPTSPSVTPPAGAEGAPSVAAEH